MAGLADLQLTVDSTTLADQAADWGTGQIPNWALEPGDPETVLTEMVARIGSILAVLAQTHAREVFRDFVQTVLRIPSLTATSASGTVTFTLADTAGHTIPAGTQLSIGDVAFTLSADAIAPGGASSVDGTVVAVFPGAAASGLSGPVTVEDLLDYVTGAALTGVTTGGTDGETVDAYVDRVHDVELPNLSPKAIWLADLERQARRNPAVDLAMAIKGYIPAGPGGTPAAQTGIEGAVTVAIRDASGADPGSAVRAQVTADLFSPDERLLNVQGSVIGPATSGVDVTFTADAWPGWDTASVRVQAIAALQGFLSGANWGQPGGGQDRRWVDEPTVRRNDLMGVLYAVQGLRHVETLTLALAGGTQGTADLTLPGPASVPSPGAVTGTVS